MKKRNKIDPTSLGNILLEWEIVTKEQLQIALVDQETLRGDDLLGRLLVAGGACTEDDIRVAMSAQASMREVGLHQIAMAIADVALGRQRRDSLLTRRENLAQQGKKVQDSITGNHFSVIAALAAKSSNE